MSSKHVCPNNPDHQEFLTVVTVGQEWKVDPYGDFIELTDDCTQIAAGPDDGNIWECAICGADAEIVTEDDDDEEEP